MDNVSGSHRMSLQASLNWLHGSQLPLDTYSPYEHDFFVRPQPSDSGFAGQQKRLAESPLTILLAHLSSNTALECRARARSPWTFSRFVNQSRRRLSASSAVSEGA